jgi:hypothetical protein
MDFEITAKRLKQKVVHKVNEHLEKKNVDSWVRYDMICNGVLSGSAISSIFHDEEVNDYDIYFKDQKIIDSIKDTFKTFPDKQKLIKAWNEYADNPDIPVIHGKSYTERAITLEHDIQFIIMGTLDQCRPTFDFIHCMPYYDFAKDKMYISPRQLESIADKMLIFNPLREKHPSEARIQKFQRRGWDLDIRKSVIPKTDLTKVPDLV